MPHAVSVNSRLGWRTDPHTGVRTWHNGTDYGMPVGTPVVAIEAGTIVAIWLNDPTNGTALTVDHRPGLPLMTSYVHLSGLWMPDGQILNAATPAEIQQRWVKELKGRRVRRGEILGLSGGRAGQWGAGKSTGPHLHLTMKEYSGTGWVAVESLDRIDWTGVTLVTRDSRGQTERRA